MSKYFIAYAYFVPGGSQGFGNIEVDRTYPIAGTTDITELTEAITDALRREMRTPSLSVAIINFREFEPDIHRAPVATDGPNNVITLKPRGR